MRKPRRPAGTDSDGAERFSIGGYFLERSFPDRGGYWYACRNDAASRRVRRRSLGVTDKEEAKIKLAALVAAAPQAGSGQAAPGPDQVLTLAVLQAYLDTRATQIASEEAAGRAVVLFTDYLTHIKRVAAPVAFWTPAQQLAFAKWSRATHGHAPSYIARLFDVMRSAFLDACAVKMRIDAVGDEVEAALLASAPQIVMTRDRIAAELQIPVRGPRARTLSIEQMAALLDSLDAPHLFRFAIMALCTWARPQALIDLDPAEQIDWNAGVIDLAPPGWVATNKRRPRQPLTRCLAGWIEHWEREDAARDVADRRAGRELVEPGLLTYKRCRVGTVKQAFRRHGAALDLPGFAQKSFRYFMTDQVKRLFRAVPREQRSLWLGHVVRDGSRTTDHYETDDPQMLADVALATDCVIALIAEHTARPLFATETLLNRKALAEIGARVMPKTLEKSRKMVGATGIEPVTPTMSTGSNRVISLQNQRKRRA